MLDQKDKEYYDLSGILHESQHTAQLLIISGALVYDPCIGDCGYVQMTVPTAQFITSNNVILNLNSSSLQAMNEMADRCGYTNVS